MFLDSQIRSLCGQLLEARTDEEAVQMASQLKAALHEHLETLRGNLHVCIAPEIAEDARLNPAPDPPKAA